MKADTSVKPGILLFMVDQLAAKWLESASSGVSPLPNINGLRRNGVTFTNAFTSNPVCLSSRATLATGLTSRGHGVFESSYRLDPSIPTFMKILQQNGWRSGAFGKVHLRPLEEDLNPDYRAYGFDTTHVTEDSRGGEWLDWVKREHPEHYETVLATMWVAKDMPGFERYGPERVNVQEKVEEIRAHFDWATPEYPNNTSDAFTLPFPEEVSQTAWITNRALEFLGDTSPQIPLFAQVSFVQPHYPYCAPAEYMGSVATEKIPIPAPQEWKDDPHAPAYFEDKGPVEGDWRHMRHCYFADIAHLDRQLGRVIDALRLTGRLENTYIVFLSDHGDLLFDHGFWGKEERHYDACIRVPLMIAGPGLRGGLVCDELVQLEDVCPTILEMASLVPPRLPRQKTNLSPTYSPLRHDHVSSLDPDVPTLAGRSLLGWCRRERPSGWREAAYVESYNSIWSTSPDSWARTIRTKKFRYTFYARRNGEQMFDMEHDPDEQHNIVADPSYAEVRQRLRDDLLELIVLQDYPRTPRNLYALGAY